MEQATAKARIAMESLKTTFLLKVHGGVPAKIGWPAAPLVDMTSNVGLLVQTVPEDMMDGVHKKLARNWKAGEELRDQVSAAEELEVSVKNAVAQAAQRPPPEAKVCILNNAAAIARMQGQLSASLDQKSRADDDDTIKRKILAEQEAWMVTIS